MFPYDAPPMPTDAFADVDHLALGLYEDVGQPTAHLHAPIPLHLSYPLPHPDSPTRAHSHQLLYTNNHHHPPQQSPPNILDYYAAAPQHLFPTPSELLTDLAAAAPHPHGPIQTRDPSPPLRSSGQQSPDPPLSLNASANKSESQRKARQRAVAEEIGFAPTDPDTISSHEKKRHYLECLEHYVLYLHEQLRLVYTPPLTLERVSTYRGLSSRSIRTLLVHMQNTNKSLHEKTLVEEQVFLDLSAEVMAAHNAGFLRRHSVDVVGTSGRLSDASAGPCSSGPAMIFDGIGVPTGASSTSSSSAGQSPVGSDYPATLGMQTQTGNAFGTFTMPDSPAAM